MKRLFLLPPDWPRFNRAFLRAAVPLLVMDLLLLAGFLGAALLAAAGVTQAVPEALGISRERSIPETLNYVKWLGALSLLAACLVRLGQPMFGYLAILFLMILADDTLLLHETLGGDVARWLEIPPILVLDPRHVGEVVVFGAMGLVAMGLIGASYLSAGPALRPLVNRYILVLAGLAVTGVAFDAAHHMVWAVELRPLRRALDLGLAIVEDGGEMIFASLACAYAWAAWSTSRYGRVDG